MHLKKLLQILSYRILIVLMCGTLASTFVKFVFNVNQVNNVECVFIKGEDHVALPEKDIVFRAGPQKVLYEPNNDLKKETYAVPYPLRIDKGLPNTS